MKLSEVMNQVDELVKTKGWYSKDSKKSQSPKNLAISISLEASELLESFQWSEQGDLASTEEELADVIIYCAQLANVMGINLEEAVRNKLQYDFERTWE
ncbi:MazG-like family protein [Halodesulfovibrio spirochaetisodalis]|nr:MazG-like family protein [Halodesulfovibrio spirochaetisodalis]